MSPPADRRGHETGGLLVWQWASCRQCVRSVSISLRSVRLNRRKRQRFVAVALLGVSHIPPHTGRRAGSLPAAPVRCNVSYVSHPFVCGYILRQDRHAAVCRCGRSGRTILPAGVVFHAVPIYALLCSLSLLSRRMRPYRIVTRLLSPVLHLS